MGSKSNTSTLLSACSSSKVRHNQFRSNGGNGNYRYVVGSVGKACATHLKWDSQSQDKSQLGQSQRNQNVAIATQVLNPSAIGGSLKNRRLVEHFGPSDDDEVGFLSDRRRSAWGKVCCYGISIAVTVVMMTGLVLAVGYMQSEKQKLTRPVKLAQGQSFEEGRLHLSTSTTTNSPPTSPLAGTTTAKPLKALIDDDIDDIDEIGIDDYINEDDLQKLDHLEENRSEENIDDTRKPSTNKEYPEEDYFEKKKVSSNTNPSDDDESHQDEQEDDDRYPYENFSEVKVLPPADFAFNGVSFEFPIYQSKNASSVKLNHGSGRSSSSSTSSNSDEETKDLETSINDANSNFTSSIDPIHKEQNELEEEYKKQKGNSLSDENYANAHSKSDIKPQSSNNKPNSLSSYSTYSTKESDSSKDDNNDRNETDMSDNRLPNSKGKKISSSFTNSLKVSGSNLNDEDKPFNEKNDEIKVYSDSLHTATLQTDIFDDADESEEDDNDFETSASEESGRNKIAKNRNDDNRRPNKNLEPSPRPNKQYDNLYSPKNRESGSHNKGSRPSGDEYFETYDSERPRSDPRKLSLKPKNYRNRPKGPTRPSQVDQRVPSKSQDKGRPSIIEIESPPSPNSHTVPILEYKADFSKFTTPSPPLETTKFDFELQSHIYSKQNNPYPDFKFDFTTPSSPTTASDTNFNLKDFIDKNNNNLNSDLSSSVPAATTDFNLNLAQVQPYTSIGNDISPGSNSATSGGSSGDSNQNNQFSKRTFYNFDFDPSTSGTVNTNTNSNPFAHLLGSQASTTGLFGSASATGATLNLFQPQQNFNFDSGSNSGGSYNIPTGTVPVDLSASHISVNGPSTSYGSPISSASNLAFTVDANGDFSLTNPSNVPYPNIEQSSNFGSSNNQQNPYSFSDNVQSNNHKGPQILTTGQGQVPTYNTITQGIHLLSLLSGNNNQQNGGYDQHSSASSSSSVYQPQELEITNKPEYQIAALTGYGGSSNQFLQGIDSNSAQNNPNSDSPGSYGGFRTFSLDHSLPSYSEDFYPKKNFRSFEHSGDQLPSASFSKSIVSKVSDTGLSLKSLEPTTEQSVFRSLLSAVKKKSESKSEPRSLSFSILPNAVGPVATTLLDKLTRSSSTSNKPQETDVESFVPKSRKRDNPGLTLNLRSKMESDLDTAGSEVKAVKSNKDLRPTELTDQNKTSTNDPTAGSNKASINENPIPKKTKAKGLTSGFYS